MILLRPPAGGLRKGHAREAYSYASKNGKENANMLTVIFTERMGEGA